MNEAIQGNHTNTSPHTSSAFNMRVINDEDSEQHLYIAETGSTNGSNSLVLTSDILNQKNVKICPQVPHQQHMPSQDAEDVDQDEDDEDDDNDSECNHKNSAKRVDVMQLSASKLSTSSGARNKRKNFQPRSIFIVEDNEEENHFENNSNDETHEHNEEHSDNESVDLMNGKSSSESYSSSVCDSSEVRLPMSSHPSIVTSITSITGIRRCASVQRPPNHTTQHQSQPLDLSHQENNGTSNGLMSASDVTTHPLIDRNVNDKNLSEANSSGAMNTTNPMDLSRKRSCSEDDMNEEDEASADEEEEDVVDLSRFKQILGYYGLKQQLPMPYKNTAEATVTTGETSLRPL
jgi:hypothetical protein